MPSVLLIDDNKEILNEIKNHLIGQGFGVTCADTGVKALICINDNEYDCIVLDALLPDLDGFTLCKAARTITDAPIIFLSSLDSSEDKLKGLTSGGDDYITKPYSLKELLARIHIVMRRGERGDRLRGDFYIDKENRIIHALGKNILLSEKEFSLFMLFRNNPNTVLSKETILSKIWYGNAEIGAVAVLVLKLRRKIEFAESVVGSITNAYGTGYYLTQPFTRKEA